MRDVLNLKNEMRFSKIDFLWKFLHINLVRFYKILQFDKVSHLEFTVFFYLLSSWHCITACVLHCTKCYLIDLTFFV
uniref:Uncharacterized protein n=1 Tax=Gorilla gorilla gorilla TaxID=9595 RepID=A0A2I2YYE5_GORGO